MPFVAITIRTAPELGGRLKRASLIALLALLPACTGEPASEVSSPSPAATPTATPSPTEEPSPDETTAEEPSPEETTSEEPEPLGDEAQYVVFPELAEVEVASSCQFEGPNGELILRATLENGGQLQLRKLPGGFLHASALPTPDADPVGTQVPTDSDWTESGGWLSGTSVMWLAGTENHIEVEYHVRWDESVPPC